MSTFVLYTTKEAGKGSGLGLATVYGIVQQSHGVISVTSAPGTGVLLLALTSEIPDEGTDVRSTPRGGVGVILLVEDEASLLKLISGTLERAGYRVLEASNGEGALAISKKARRIDLLITDVVMPGMTGPQLVEALQQGGQLPVVLFMSGYAQELIGKRAPEIDFLPKPFTPNALLEKVHEVLGPARRREHAGEAANQDT